MTTNRGILQERCPRVAAWEDLALSLLNFKVAMLTTPPLCWVLSLAAWIMGVA